LLLIAIRMLLIAIMIVFIQIDWGVSDAREAVIAITMMVIAIMIA